MQWRSVYAKYQAMEQQQRGDFVDSSWYYPCNQFEDNDAASSMCYRYQANYFLSQTDYSINEAIDLCMGITDKNYIPICLKGISAHTAKNNFDDIEKTKLMCNDFPNDYQQYCIKGAIESLTRFVDDDLAEDFCLMIDDEFEEDCIKRHQQLLDLRQ